MKTFGKFDFFSSRQRLRFKCKGSNWTILACSGMLICAVMVILCSANGNTLISMEEQLGAKKRATQKAALSDANTCSTPIASFSPVHAWEWLSACRPAITRRLSAVSRRMRCYLCSVISGSLTLLEHEASAWLDRGHLRSVQWLPADETVISKIETLL